MVTDGEIPDPEKSLVDELNLCKAEMGLKARAAMQSPRTVQFWLPLRLVEGRACSAGVVWCAGARTACGGGDERRNRRARDEHARVPLLVRVVVMRVSSRSGVAFRLPVCICHFMVSLDLQSLPLSSCAGRP